MTIAFAIGWNSGKNDFYKWKSKFGRDEALVMARRCLKQAILLSNGLRDEIDKNSTRLINGPHRSDDNSVHMTVLCLDTSSVYHVKVNGNFNCAVAPSVWPSAGITGPSNGDFLVLPNSSAL